MLVLVMLTRAQPRGPRVTLRIPGRVAWPLWGLAMLLAATATALQAANHGVHSELVPGVFFVFGFGTVGAVAGCLWPWAWSRR
jgi:lipopolysaccharide export LptBFGC system permease protein LptF